MRRAEASQYTNKRNVNVSASQTGLGGSTGGIMENISYLNRNCKFLSYAEKERLIEQLKAQDPDTETLVSSLRENNVPKEELKTILNTFLYPKAASKKALDNVNQQRAVRQPYGNASVSSSVQLKKSTVVPAVKVELGGGQSQPPKAARSVDKTTPNQVQRGAAQKSQGNLYKSQDLQRGGFYDNSPNIQGGDSNKNKATGAFGKAVVSKTPRTPASAGFAIEQSQASTERGRNIDYAEDNNRYGNQAYEGTSDEFLTSIGMKPQKAGGFIGAVPAGVHIKTESAASGKGGKSIKEITFGAHGSSKTVANELRTREEEYEDNSAPLDSNVWKQAGLPRPNEKDNKKLNEKKASDKAVPKKNTKEPERKSKDGDYRLSGVSERTKEVLQSLLGDIGNGEMYNNLMKKLEENNVQTGVDSRNNIEDSETEHEFMQTRKVPKGIATNLLEQPLVKRSMAIDQEIEGYTEGNKRLGSLGEEPVFSTRTEKYVSVNMIKRILDSNSIYTENIVDEVFRYLGENIVNKNYFAQIIGNFLNCLPEQHGVQIQDIVNKMFEICDRNGDGVISPNDLGSGATLFSQYQPTLSKERRLYRLFDPQNRGFIIETDIVSVLTKTNTIASASGAKLYEGPEEIAEVAQRLIKELDKEKKGIVTYWDIFLWKDTQNFSDLVSQLERYTNKLDFLSSTKKSLISSPQGRSAQQDLLSEINRKSPVNEIPRLYSAYSPDMKIQQGSASYRVNTDTELPKATTQYPQTARVTSTSAFVTNDNITTTVVPTFQAYQPSSYLQPTYQSPGNQGLVQHLSAFESISKDVNGTNLTPLGTSPAKDYQVDFTISPQSKPYTPYRDVEIKSNTSPIAEEQKYKTATSVMNYGINYAADIGTGKTDETGKMRASDLHQDNPTGTIKSYYEYEYNPTSYLVSSHYPKESLDYAGKTDNVTSSYLGESSNKDYLNSNTYNLKIDSKEPGYTYHTTSTYDIKGFEEKTLPKKEEGGSLFNSGMGNLNAKSYNYVKDASSDRKELDKFETKDLLGRKGLQKSIYVDSVKESGGSLNPPMSYAADEGDRDGHGFRDAVEDYKKNHEDYNYTTFKPSSVVTGSEGKNYYSDVNESPEKKSYGGYDSQGDNYEIKNYGSGSYSGYKDISKEGYEGTNSPAPRGYLEEYGGSQGSDYKAAWYQNSEDQKRYGSIGSETPYGIEGSEASGKKDYQSYYYGSESGSAQKY